MTLKRMDNVGIVVESLDAVIPFFVELGLRLEGRATIEGEWAGRVTGLGTQHVEIAMLVTPDGHSRLELSRFLTPPVVADHRERPGERARLPARHVHGGRHRRDACPAPAGTARSSSAKSSSIRIRIGSATSAAPKACSSASPRSSSPVTPHRREWRRVSMSTALDDFASLGTHFRDAVSAIDAGDIVTLQRLVTAHPVLVREALASPGAWLRDTIGGALDGFFQRPYLLWFVAEDPVRNGKLPGNIAGGGARDHRHGTARGRGDSARATRLRTDAGVVVLDRATVWGTDRPD